MRKAWDLARCSVTHWLADYAATTGAALAFYCAFSLAPLLVILVTIAGWIVGAEIASGYLEGQLNALFGPATAGILLAAMRSSQEAQGLVATGVSFATLIIGATTVLAALESALEQIWRARTLVPTGFKGWIRTRLLSFGVILAIGFLLLVSLTLSTGLSRLRAAITRLHAELVVLIAGLDLVLSLALTTGFFALVYRYLPARRLPWRPVLWGGLLTALLFYVGKWAIGLYLARSTQPSAFGAAASFAALLLWLYYSAQIFLLGAEFTACLGGLRKLDEGQTAPRTRHN